MKRICFTIQNVNAQGGEERMCTMLANYLADEGYFVSIVSLTSRQSNHPFYQISKKVKVVHILGSFVERRVNQFFPFIKYVERKYRAFLRRNRIDIIIDVDTLCTPLTCSVIKGLRIKHIAWDHFNYGRFKQRKEFKTIFPLLLNNVDRLVVLTKDDERHYHEDGKIPTSKIVQIYNFAPLQEHERHEHHTKTVLAMGRLTSQKGFDLLIDAWKIIAKDVSDWTLRIVGDGELKEVIQRNIEISGLRNIQLVPSTKNPRKEYLNADIFVLSSRYEGFPLVLIEAANFSLPIISFDCDNGPREIIKDGVNGLLVMPNNFQELAKKIKILIKNDSLRQNMSDVALESVSNLKKDNIFKQWIDLIETV